MPAAATILRKACRICTKRKRKCIVSLPRCQRCRRLSLECIYDLEPLVSRHESRAVASMQTRQPDGDTAPTSSPSSSFDFLQYISSLHMSSRIYAVLPLPFDRPLAHSFTAVPLAQDPEAVRFILAEMRLFPSRVREGKTTPFTHASILDPILRKYIDSADCGGDSDFHALDTTAGSVSMALPDLVAATQALILRLIAHAFRAEDRAVQPQPKHIKTSFHLLTRWRTRLWKSGFRGLSDTPPPSAWHSWILAESVRRTILMAYLVEGTYCAWRAGWCTHQLFVYALPFSARGRLWLAETEKEWAALARPDDAAVDSGGETSRLSAARELVSLKEFTMTFAATPFEPGDDLFQRLLLVSHHGKHAVDDRLAKIAKVDHGVGESTTTALYFDTAERPREV
jgi:hypothetical protein